MFLTTDMSEKSTDIATVVQPAINEADNQHTATTVVDRKLSTRLTKHHVLIAVALVVVVGLAITCVLVALRMTTDAQNEIIKYTMKYRDSEDNKVNTSVSVDNNVVMYRTKKDGQEILVVNDFDRNIQVAKVQLGSSVACYVSALNRSMADEPANVPSRAPTVNSSTPYDRVVYSAMTEPISDITFLGRRVSSMCYNIPTYWEVPKCNGDSPAARSKRSWCYRRVCVYLCYRYLCYWRCWFVIYRC